MSKLNELIKKLCSKGVEYKKISDVCDVVGRIGFRGYTRSDQVEKNHGAISLSPSNIVNGKIDYNNCTYISWEKYNESPEIMVKEGDIIFCKTASVGKTCYIKGLPEKATINPQLILLKNILINSKYLSYCLQSDNFQKKANSIKGLGTIQTISQKDFNDLTVPVPPVEVQEEIVKILDKFDELEVELEVELEARKSQYEFWCTKLFANVDGERRKLNELLDYIQPSKYIVSNTEYSNEYNTPVLTAGLSFVLGYTNETNGIYNATKDNPVIIFDDFTTSNHWVDFNFKVKSSAMKMLVPKTSDNFRYIYYSIKNIKYIPKEHSRQWIQTYGNFEIILPSIKEQNHIVKILDKFDSLVNDITVGLPAEIELRRKQYEYYRNKLLSFEELSVSE